MSAMAHSGGVVVRRREFIALVGGVAATWPLGARAQQQALPVIGYLSSRSPRNSADIIAAFRRGLNDEGFVEGRNVMIESRFADGKFDQLPALAAELIARNVSVLVATGGTVSAVKAKPVVPKSMPLVFAMGGDPVKLGLVSSLNRPGENLTGVAFLVNGLAAKQVELLHQLVPKAPVMGFLVNPKDPNAEGDIRDAQAAASALARNWLSAEPAPKAKSIRPSRNSAKTVLQLCLWTPSRFFWTAQKNYHSRGSTLHACRIAISFVRS